MEDLGKKIAELRNEHGMTQKDMGEKLNVSAQAVSKWENGQSEPDLSTIKNMCALFDISVSDLIDTDDDKKAAPDTEPKASAEPAVDKSEKAAPEAEQAAAAAEPRVISGYCDRCKKPVGPDEYVVRHHGRSGQTIYCNECNEKIESGRRISEYQEYLTANKRSFIWGPIAGAVMLAIVLASLLTSSDFSTGAAVAISIVTGVGIFTFVTQVFWGGAVIDLFFFFVKSFSMPGVIFSLSLEGLAFLIVVKVLFAALSVILSVLWFLVGLLVVIPVVSLVIFPFALIKRLNEGKRLRAAANRPSKTSK